MVQRYDEPDNRNNERTLLDIIREAVKDCCLNPDRVRKVWVPKRREYDFYPLEDIMRGVSSIRRAVEIFRLTEKTDPRNPTAIDPIYRPMIISYIIRRDLSNTGHFFKRGGAICYHDHNLEEDIPTDCPKWDDYLWTRYGVETWSSKDLPRYIREDIQLFARPEAVDE